MRKLLKCMIAVLLTLSLISTQPVIPQAYHAEKDLPDPERSGAGVVYEIASHEPDDTVRVNIAFEAPSTLDKGYSPVDIGENKEAVAYGKKLWRDHDKALGEMEKAIGYRPELVWNYSVIVNAISVEMKYKDVKRISEMAGVRWVEVEEHQQARAERDPASDAVEDNASETEENRGIRYYSPMLDLMGADELHELGYYGAGEKIAILSSGIQDSHLSFSEDAYLYAVDGEDYYLHPRPYRYSQISNEQFNQLSFAQNGSVNVEDTFLNEKIPFRYSYYYKDNIVDVWCERGTYAAGVAAGNRFIPNYENGGEFEEVLPIGGEYDWDYIKEHVLAPGVSPDAQLYIMSVYGDLVYSNGQFASKDFYFSDVVAAIGDAMTLGCDVCYFDYIEYFPVVMGPGCNPTCYTMPYSPLFQETLNRLIDKDSGMLFLMCGNANGSMQNNWIVDWVNGGHREKTFVDVFLEDVNLYTLTGWGALADGLRVGSSRNVERENAQMLEESSWGVPGSLLLKPEIVAQGESVYGALGIGRTNPSRPPSPPTAGFNGEYSYKAKTSGNASQVCGLAALLDQYMKENQISIDGYSRRALIQSLLMSTAMPIIDPDTGTYASVLHQGAGLVDLKAAVSAKTAVFMDPDDDTLTAFTGGAKDGKVKAELGDDPEKNGVYSYSFRINNLTGTEDVYFSAPRTDVFTQGYYYRDENGEIAHTNGPGCTGPYVDLNTVPAGAQVSYSWSCGTESGLQDIDGNGKKNEQDAQAILEYLAGNTAASALNLTNADVNGDGRVTSYDAHLYLAGLNGSDSELVVPAGGYADVTVTFSFSVDDIYTSGAYIEGYTYLTELSGKDGEETVVHSIPILGFYGKWSDASMLDHASMVDSLYLEEGEEPPRGYADNDETNYLTIRYPAYGSEDIFTGNPYFWEDAFEEGRLAVRSDTPFENFRYTLIRDAIETAAVVSLLDGYGGNILSSQCIVPIEYYTNAKRDYSTWFCAWYDQGVRELSLDGFTAADAGLKDGDVFRIGLYTLLEYDAMMYHQRKGMSLREFMADAVQESEMDDFLKSNTYEKGSYLGYDIVVDDTAPVIGPVRYNSETRDVTFTMTDNCNLAVLLITGNNGSGTFHFDVPAAGSYEITINLDDIEAKQATSVKVFVGDYAMNEATLEITLDEIKNMTAPQCVSEASQTEEESSGDPGQMMGTETPKDRTEDAVQTVVVDPSDEINCPVSVEIREEEDSTNGMLLMGYDPQIIHFTGMNSGLGHVAYHMDDENGEIRFVYADKETIRTEELLANLQFEVRKCAGGGVVVKTEERNDAADMDEMRLILLPETHDWVYGKAEWTNISGSYEAYALYFCDACQLNRYAKMEIVGAEQIEGAQIVYTARISKDDSLDGIEHEVTYTVRQSARKKTVIEPIKPIVPRDPIVWAGRYTSPALR